MKTFNAIILALLIIGALNWGFIGAFGFDFVEKAFGSMDSVVTRIIYVIVGIAGILGLFLFKTLTVEEDRPHHTNEVDA